MEGDIRNPQQVTGQRSPRWAFMSRMAIASKVTPGETYLDRLRIVQTPYFGVYLHWIHEPDSDRDPHDHPWNFGSFILKGGYTERVWEEPALGTQDYKGYRRKWGQFSWHKMDTVSAHKIEQISKPLVTLVLVGRRTRNWGFWQQTDYPSQARFVTWQNYENAGTVT